MDLLKISSSFQKKVHKVIVKHFEKTVLGDCCDGNNKDGIHDDVIVYYDYLCNFLTYKGKFGNQ